MPACGQSLPIKAEHSFSKVQSFSGRLRRQRWDFNFAFPFGRKTNEDVAAACLAASYAVASEFSGGAMAFGMSRKLPLILVLLSVCQTFCVASPECTVELEPEEVRQRRIEALKVQILSKLGMTKPPNIDASKLGPIPPDILESYHASLAGRKRRSVEETQAISPGDHYYEQRITLIPATLQGRLRQG